MQLLVVFRTVIPGIKEGNIGCQAISRDEAVSIGDPQAEVCIRGHPGSLARFQILDVCECNSTRKIIWTGAPSRSSTITFSHLEDYDPKDFEGVPDTIHTLQMAGIKALTGDRQETATNITPVMSFDLRANELGHRKRAIWRNGELEDLALIIDGKSLVFALEKGISKTFVDLAVMCKAVICYKLDNSPWSDVAFPHCRSASHQAREKEVLLAIGDGANDVSISGVEPTVWAAARAGFANSGSRLTVTGSNSDIAQKKARKRWETAMAEERGKEETAKYQQQCESEWVVLFSHGSIAKELGIPIGTDTYVPPNKMCLPMSGNSLKDSSRVT
ncbi:hypothetical protein BD410DRAFT_842923 [Rickenella mellea]|uniref:HAD-like protein n=1 Tax=Rickenella mellea TaxID=50990 RepID=A0A4Y7PTW2_9AGAM|nr:hypothetical protein BD410DRAFT_842923 [Rickenella mellea]